MIHFNGIKMARQIARQRLEAMRIIMQQRIRTIPCDDCVTPEDCYEEGECAIENGEDE